MGLFILMAMKMTKKLTKRTVPIVTKKLTVRTVPTVTYFLMP